MTDSQSASPRRDRLRRQGIPVKGAAVEDDAIVLDFDLPRGYG